MQILNMLILLIWFYQNFYMNNYFCSMIFQKRMIKLHIISKTCLYSSMSILHNLYFSYFEMMIFCVVCTVTPYLSMFICPSWTSSKPYCFYLNQIMVKNKNLNFLEIRIPLKSGVFIIRNYIKLFFFVKRSVWRFKAVPLLQKLWYLSLNNPRIVLLYTRS